MANLNQSMTDDPRVEAVTRVIMDDDVPGNDLADKISCELQDISRQIDPQLVLVERIVTDHDSARKLAVKILATIDAMPKPARITNDEKAKILTLCEQVAWARAAYESVRYRGSLRAKASRLCVASQEAFREYVNGSF